MENKIYLKKVLLLEFGCYYVTELALQLHVTQSITAINLPLVQSCFLRPFTQLLHWVFHL